MIQFEGINLEGKLYHEDIDLTFWEIATDFLERDVDIYGILSTSVPTAKELLDRHP